MKGFLTTLSCAALLVLPFLLTSCGSSGGGSVSENRSSRGYNPGVGPFDSSGNYVERWADDKSKGRWWRKSTTTPSAVAKTKTSKVPPPVVASNVTPRPPTSQPTVRPLPPVGGYTPPPSPRPKPPAATTSKPKPKPVARTKPKSKAPVTHIIKKGDTLYGLSRKYGASVTAIQRANGLKGTNLRIGRKLLIPRY